MIRIIAAVSQDGVYGTQEGLLPWSIPSEIKYFKEMTMGQTIIMGRLTWESLRRKSPLPGRQNIVITSSTEQLPAGIQRASSIEEAISMSDRDDIYFIGGISLWKAGILSLAEEIFVSVISSNYLSEGALVSPELLNPGNYSTRAFVREIIKVSECIDQLTGCSVKINFIRYSIFSEK